MAEKLWIEVLNMSLTGSVIIGAVMVFRLLLRRAPRIFSYALWAAVLFRLLCPVSFSSPLSLLGVLQNDPASQGKMTYIPTDIGYQMDPQIHLPIPAAEEAVNAVLPDGNPSGSVNPLQINLYVCARIWILGLLGMVLYSLLSWVRFGKVLKQAVRERDNLYRLLGEGTPFVYGILAPKIYMPRVCKEEEEAYLLLHEQVHIRRGDHLFRLLAYAALCLHWFNPLVWLAFALSGRDMEMSCDEAVIRRMGNEVKKEYSRSLLSLASGKGPGRGIPAAFGEGDTRSRVKHVLSYRKPSGYLAGAVAAVCVILAGFLLANPAGVQEKENPNVFYGVVALGMPLGEEEETGPMVVRIPGLGDMDIPRADQVVPYIETDFDGLEIGDLVRITFPKDEEIVIMETYPAQFSGKAELIEVMGRGMFQIEPADGGAYAFAVPLGLAPEAKEGALLEIYHHDPEIDGKKTELLAAVPVQSVNAEEYQIWVELSAEELKTFLAEYGFGIRCQAGQKAGAGS